jgi:hypothetical protein
MEHADLLRYVTSEIEALGLRYFVTGSVATIFYGEPRFTNDIDIVVDLPLQRVSEFCERFPDPEFYADEEAAREAVRRRRQFNIIHPGSGLKVDIIIPEDSPFDRSRFARRRQVQAGENYQASFASPEDVIIKKMVYCREGGSEKHLRDIAGVLKACEGPVDREYIAEWAALLDLQEIWRAILDRVEQEKTGGEER